MIIGKYLKHESVNKFHIFSNFIPFDLLTHYFDCANKIDLPRKGKGYLFPRETFLSPIRRDIYGNRQTM